MQLAVLAGGLGTRLAEETDIRPKPMVEIGGRPILWHILGHYAHHGIRESVIAIGYRGDFIKRFFLEHVTLLGHLSVDLATGAVTRQQRRVEDWRVQLVETGSDTETGGRVRRLADWLRGQTFHLTYGDGVSDVDLDSLLRFHRRMGRTVTITAVRPPARFGGLLFDGDDVCGFTEKPQAGEGWINGGFMVCERRLFDYLDGDGASLERDALERLAAEGELAAYRHHGFWQCMDTLRDKRHLEALWAAGEAPWWHEEPAAEPETVRMVA